MKKNDHSSPGHSGKSSPNTSTRKEIAAAYGVTPRTFRRWLKKHHIELSSGLLKPRDLQRIYRRFAHYWTKLIFHRKGTKAQSFKLLIVSKIAAFASLRLRGESKNVQ